MPWNRRHLLRDFEAGRQLDLFLVAAVCAVLGIRFYLEVTGYPQVGGETLHIAHMLWGGLLMLAAQVMLLSFVGRGSHRVAALLGGLGFGTFIDEVGKFVTHDNDYFYQPAVAIIYVIFVLLYLAIRSLHRERAASGPEYLANALLEIQQLALGDLDRQERDRARRYLTAWGADRPPAPQLRAILADAALVDAERPGRFAHLARGFRDRVRRLLGAPWFGRALIAFFLVQLLARLVRVVALFWPLPRLGERLLAVPLINPVQPSGEELTVLQWLLIGANALASLLVALGVVAVVRGRLLVGLRRFQRSVLVTIVLGQVFVFYRVEWLGLLELAFHLVVLAALQVLIARHRER
jgi:hypothetical protein